MNRDERVPPARSWLEVPEPPAWRVDWKALEKRFAWIASLGSCVQDPIHHAEGNVLVHTRMVVEALSQIAGWRALPATERELVFAAALFHDIAKPATTKVGDDGRVTAKGHSSRGDSMTRVWLYKAGIEPRAREAICALIRFHQIPFFLIERDGARETAAKTAHRVSQCARMDHLALVAEADARGRTCADQQRMLDNVALFVETCRDEACLTAPRAFASEHSRFLYFRKDGRDPNHAAFDDCSCEVTITSGVAGAGKDTWLAKNRTALPVVSLDAIRGELDVEPTDDQGAVVQEAKERVREHLRARRDFAFNATNLTRDFRGRWIDLFADYRARVRIAAIETPWLTLRERARSRTVPFAVVEKMLDRWQFPDASEAHSVEWIVTGAA